MKILIYFLVAGLLFASFYSFCKIFFVLPPRLKNRNLKNLSKDSWLDSLLQPVIKKLAPLIKLSTGKEQLLTYQLEEWGVKYKPNEYYARALILSGFALLLMPFFYLIGLVYFCPLSVILAVLVYLKILDDLNSKLKRKKAGINRTLPNFVRAILFQINDITNDTVQIDLIKVFEDYLKIADPVFAPDVSRLVSDMKLTGDIENSLQKFGERLGIEEITRLCNILIGIHRGENQQEALMFLSKDIDTKARENIKLELAKRKPKVRRATMPMAAITCIAIVYTLVVYLFRSYANL